MGSVPHYASLLHEAGLRGRLSRLLAGDRIAAFWYEKSNGLAEIAVNQGRADRDLGLAIGTPVAIVA